MLSNDYDSENLSFECRVNLWRRATSADSLKKSNPGLCDGLKKMQLFAHASFPQIHKDAPRLFTLDHKRKNEVTDKHVKQLIVSMLTNYTKRNSTVEFLQSQGVYASLIAQACHYGNVTDQKETAFWIYSCIVEEIQPIGFYQFSIEPLLLQAVFNRLFEILDPLMYSIWKDIPSVVLVRYFMSLFVDMKRISIGLALFDLIILLGSNCLTSTIYNPKQVPVNTDRPFCRTV